MRIFNRQTISFFIICSVILFGMITPIHYAQANQPYLPQVELSLKAGNQRSIGRLSVLFPLLQSSNQLLYGTIIGMHDTKSNKEGNFAIGYRRLMNDTIYGAYGFYDIRATKYNNIVHQLTLGAEYLKENFEFRANAYIPSNKSFTLGDKVPFADVKYISGTKVVIVQGTMQEIERPLGGFDIEAGYGLKGLFGAVAFYHFGDNKKQSFSGVRARAEAKLKSWLKLESEYSYDKSRGHNIFAGINLSWSLGKQNQRLSKLSQKMTQLPVRDVDVVSLKDMRVDVNSVLQAKPIRTPGDFLNINKNLAGHYVQMNDIDFQGYVFTGPIIGDATRPFKGKYFGQGFALGGFTIKCPSIRIFDVYQGRVAIFDTLENAYIRGINLRNTRFIANTAVNAKFYETKIKIASIAIDAKGTSVIEYIKTHESVGFDIENDAGFVQIAGLIHTIGQHATLQHVQHNMTMNTVRCQLGYFGLGGSGMSGVAYHNHGLIFDIERKQPIISSELKVAGVAFTNHNLATISNVRVGDVSSIKANAYGVTEYNSGGTIKKVSVGNVRSESRQACGVAKSNSKGTILNVRVGNVSSVEKSAYGVTKTNNSGIIKKVSVGNVSSESRQACGVAESNSDGTILNVRVGNVGSVNESACGVAAENGNGHIKNVRLGNVSSVYGDAYGVTFENGYGYIANVRVGNVSAGMGAHGIAYKNGDNREIDGGNIENVSVGNVSGGLIAYGVVSDNKHGHINNVKVGNVSGVREEQYLVSDNTDGEITKMYLKIPEGSTMRLLPEENEGNKRGVISNVLVEDGAVTTPFDFTLVPKENKPACKDIFDNLNWDVVHLTKKVTYNEKTLDDIITPWSWSMDEQLQLSPGPAVLSKSVFNRRLEELLKEIPTTSTTNYFDFRDNETVVFENDKIDFMAELDILPEQGNSTSNFGKRKRAGGNNTFVEFQPGRKRLKTTNG